MVTYSTCRIVEERPVGKTGRTVLQMLNDAEGLFTTDADKEEFLQTIKKRGKINDGECGHGQM
jgi:hypothetical protein